MVTRKPWYKTIHFFTTMTISRNHWIWPLIMRVSWWVPLKRPPKWHWIAGIYGPNGLVLILEKIRNLGPNRTRTKKIFKFLDRTGPGARKIFKSRTKTTKILKISDQFGPIGPWIPAGSLYRNVKKNIPVETIYYENIIPGCGRCKYDCN